jgi:hypothetical protein
MLVYFPRIFRLFFILIDLHAYFEVFATEPVIIYKNIKSMEKHIKKFFFSENNKMGKFARNLLSRTVVLMN